MLKKLFNIKSVLLICLFITMWIKTAIFLDPDFGWRLRTGFLVIQSGIPKIDLFSYTMPSFPWVDHAWLTDIIISTGYKIFGGIGLAALFSILTIIALVISATGGELSKNLKSFILVKPIVDKNLWYFGTPSFILSIAILIPFLGIRAQVVTWLMFAVLLRIVFDEKLWKQFKFLTPLFFLLWVNLHGGFALGLFVLYLVFFVRFIKNWEINYQDLFFILLSTFTTFINPYGKEVYREVLSSISDNSLRWEIVEWRPAFLNFDIPTLSLITLFLIFISICRKRIKSEKIIVSVFLLSQGIMSVRNIPLWALSAVPIIIESINYFYDDICSIGKSEFKKIRIKRFKKLYTFFWIYTLSILFVETYLSYRGAKFFSEANFYPLKAISFLKDRNPNGEIFSEYSWGGYLIWKYPEKKVFIDGRMPSWKWNSRVTRESNNVMEDYLGITKGKNDYSKYFEKYNIKTVLLSKREPKELSVLIREKLGEKLEYFDKIFNSENYKFILSKKLENDGWKIIYEDEISRIYQY